MISRERVGTEFGLMTGRIKKSFRNGKHNISSLQDSLRERTRRAARKTDYYVHDNAWTMMAASAGLAFVVGFVLSRGNQQQIAAELGADLPDARSRIQKLNSKDLMLSSIPLALFLWRAYQATRCARKATV